MLNKSTLKFTLYSAALVTTWSGLTSSAKAFDFTLTDGNSIVDFDNTLQTGVFDWTVNGTPQVFEMSTFIKTNANNVCDSGFILVGSGCFDDRNGVLTGQTDNTAQITYTFSDPNPDPDGNKIDLFEVILDYTLTGGGEKGFLSSFNQKVTINNLSTNTYDFEVIEYYNLELGGNLDGDRASIDPTAPFPGLQVDNDGDLSVDGTLYATITSDTSPDAYEVGSPFSLPNSITSPTFPGLINNTGPVIGDGSFEEPAFAYRIINQQLTGGGMVMNEQTVTLQTVEIPEPSLLFGLGGLVFSGLFLSRKHDK